MFGQMLSGKCESTLGIWWNMSIFKCETTWCVGGYVTVCPKIMDPLLCHPVVFGHPSWTTESSIETISNRLKLLWGWHLFNLRVAYVCWNIVRFRLTFLVFRVSSAWIVSFGRTVGEFPACSCRRQCQVPVYWKEFEVPKPGPMVYWHGTCIFWAPEWTSTGALIIFSWA